jgi:transposase
MDVSTIGLDLAKSVFQLHGVDTRGKVVVSKRLRRGAVLTFFANLPRCVRVPGERDQRIRWNVIADSRGT